jgi:Glycosyltransferase family 87
MKRGHLRVVIFVFLSAVISFCVWRDMQIEKQYTSDLRNRVVGARLQIDGRLPYFYKWQPVDGLRYFDPARWYDKYSNAITASPFFHHLLYPIAELPQRQISHIWLGLEYLMFVLIVLIAFSFTKNGEQQCAVAIGAALFLFTQAWTVHVSAGQMYIILPLLAFVFLFGFTRKHQLLFSLLSGLAAAVMILIRPTCLLFFIPFMFSHVRFKPKESILFFLPVIFLFGYSIFNAKERAYWLEYRQAIAAHIKYHQSNDPDNGIMTYNPGMYKNWEGWDSGLIQKAKIDYPFQWRSETSSLGVFSKDALHMSIPVWVLSVISCVSILCLIFLFRIRQNSNHTSGIILIAIFGFCLYMISDYLSPLLRIQYYGVQWIFPLLLLAAFYDKRLKIIFLLVIAGLLLNIVNTPYLKMRHTIGELIILFTLLWLCLSPKSQLIQ